MRIVRVLAGLAGLVGVILAIPVFVAGTGLLWWSTDGGAELPTVTVRTDARAFVATDIDAVWSDTDYPIPRVERAALSVDGDGPLFVGIGPSGDVDRFIDGDGAPVDQDFWVYMSDGAAAGVDWDLEPGRWSAVVMNPDGSAGVDAEIRAVLPAAPIRTAGAILAVVGLVIGAIASLVMAAAWGGGRTRRPRAVPITV